MKCVSCGREDDLSLDGSFVLSAHGWLCSAGCYASYCKKREQSGAREVWGDEATI
jgi:hypothetical protein